MQFFVGRSIYKLLKFEYAYSEEGGNITWNLQLPLVPQFVDFKHGGWGSELCIQFCEKCTELISGKWGFSIGIFVSHRRNIKSRVYTRVCVRIFAVAKWLNRLQRFIRQKMTRLTRLRCEQCGSLTLLASKGRSFYIHICVFFHEFHNIWGIDTTDIKNWNTYARSYMKGYFKPRHASPLL